ncbi:MAG: DUF362 domain-containing protein [Acidimicrobiia bacterium]
MAASEVYYMDARSESPQTGLVAKMLTVFEAAGLDQLITPGDLVAIKMHCGEWNNTAYLRPVYPRALADRVKELGGRPFVCDTTTLTYQPHCSRATELDILMTAERNGFTSAALGCPFICADGFIGTSDYRVDVPTGYILKEAYIAQAVAAADVLLVLSHFKGHGSGVIGGAIKNLGIGCQSKRGKHNVHLGGHPKYSVGNAVNWHPENFQGKANTPGWQILEDCCPYGLFKVDDGTIHWDRGKCTSCMGCMGVMAPRNLFEFPTETLAATDAAIADGALGAVTAVGKEKCGFINLAIDISPGCDCVSFADMPIVPNLGVFASTDPVAIDMACLEKVHEAHGMPGSIVDDFELMAPGGKRFETVSARVPNLSEEAQMNTGVLNGLGNREYTLIETEPQPMARHIFSLDKRPTGQRFGEKFKKFTPFPYDRHEGQGFLREPEIDTEYVKSWHGNGHNGGIGRPADAAGAATTGD